MASARLLSDRAAAQLIQPRLGPGVCRRCFNLTHGFDRCYACARGEQRLAALVPISYSVAGEPLHRTLASYKRERVNDVVAARAAAEIAAILWRFLAGHERCVAAQAGVERFDLVTTVPSGDRERDERHPLRRIVGELVGPTRRRHQRALRRTRADVVARRFDAQRFEAVTGLSGEAVLLIDDTWTSGASAESAAAALLAAGAGSVGAVVIGRYLNPRWGENRSRLDALRGGYDYSACTVCVDSGAVGRAAA
jgi:predicted amidophosphoribosyltransferase